LRKFWKKQPIKNDKRTKANIFIYFVLLEEPQLKKKFGEEYREYKKNVPSWMPRLKPFILESEKL
jgi:hypothetical protein